MKKNNYKKKEIEFPFYKTLIMYIIMAFMIIIPWIAYVKVIQLGNAEVNLYQSYMGITADLYLYFKGRVVELFAVFLVCWFIGERIFPDNVIKGSVFKNRKDKWLYIFVGVYGLCVICSALLSEHMGSAIWGSLSEGEGMFTLLAYIVIMFGVYNYFSNKKAIEVFQKALFILSAIVIVLSLIEFLYKPIVEIGLFKWLISDESTREFVNSVDTSAFKDMVTLTFYNPNYFGGFCIVVYPLVLVTGLSKADLKKRIPWFVLMSGMVFCIVSSKATTSVYVCAIETIFIALWIFIKNRKAIVNFVAFAGLSAVLLVILNLISSDKLFSVFFAGATNEDTYSVSEDTFVLEDIILDGASLKLVGEKNVLVVNYEDYQLKVADGNGESLETKIEDNKITVLNEEYKGISVSAIGYSGENVQCKIMVDAGYKDTIDFYIADDKFTGISSGGKINNNIKKDDYSGEEYYSLFTGRGYAWINTLPLIKNTIFIGKGPGNFNYYFDHNDYLGMLNTHGTVKRIVDKPHNGYLQMAVNIGVVGTVAYIIFMLIILARMIKNSFGSSGEEWSGMTISVAITIVGYMIYLMLNDSMVVVSPMLYIVVGFGLALCDYYKKGDVSEK